MASAVGVGLISVQVGQPRSFLVLAFSSLRFYPSLIDFSFRIDEVENKSYLQWGVQQLQDHDWEAS